MDNDKERGEGQEKDEGEKGKSQDLNQLLTSIVTRLDSLEEKLTIRKGAEVPTPEQLLAEIEEGKMPFGKGKEEEEGEIDWEELRDNPKQLMDVMLKQVEEQYYKPLIQHVEFLKVKSEVSACEKKYPDFWDHKKEIWALAHANPYLTVEQAYLLARAAKEKGTKLGEEDKSKGKGKSVGKPFPIGEKPGISSASTQKGEPKTLKEAVTRALAEMGEGEKT